MKVRNQISILFTLLLFQVSFSQTGTSIIFQNGDTLVDSKIYTDSKMTNFKKLTFEKEEQVITSSPQEIIAYWDGTNYYSSKSIKNGEKYFVNQILSGPLEMSQFFDKSGSATYIVKLEDEEQFNVLNKKENLSAYFSSLLPSYTEFRKNYLKNPTYSKKSIGEFASAYNQFKNPEKYKFVKFKHDSKFYVGISALHTSNFFSTDLGSFESGENTHSGIAISGRINVTPSISLMGMLGKTKSDVIITRGRLIMNSTFFESHILFSLIGESKLNILLGPNIALYFNSNSAYEVSRQTQAAIFIDSSDLEGISTGYGFNLMVTYPFSKVNLGGIIGLGGRNINAKENDLIVSGYKGNSKILRLGLIVEF